MALGVANMGHVFAPIRSAPVSPESSVGWATATHPQGLAQLRWARRRAIASLEPISTILSPGRSS